MTSFTFDPEATVFVYSRIPTTFILDPQALIFTPTATSLNDKSNDIPHFLQNVSSIVAWYPEVVSSSAVVPTSPSRPRMCNDAKATVSKPSLSMQAIKLQLARRLDPEIDSFIPTGAEGVIPCQKEQVFKEIFVCVSAMVRVYKVSVPRKTTQEFGFPRNKILSWANQAPIFPSVKIKCSSGPIDSMRILMVRYSTFKPHLKPIEDKKVLIYWNNLCSSTSGVADTHSRSSTVRELYPANALALIDLFVRSNRSGRKDEIDEHLLELRDDHQEESYNPDVTSDEYHP